MTDVNIAVRLLADAFEDRFDMALLLSADSDLTTPVQQVLHRFPEKRVVIAQPPGRNSTSLCRAASGYFTIGEAKLRRAQLPACIVPGDGHELARPDHWRLLKIDRRRVPGSGAARVPVLRSCYPRADSQSLKEERSCASSQQGQPVSP